MSQFFDVGHNRIIALKKCGSCTITHMLTQERFKGRRTGPAILIVTFVRNPFARLVSGWTDLIADRGYRWANPYGVDRGLFKEWALGYLKIPVNEMDHHFRPQAVELREAFDLADPTTQCRLWIGQLEYIHQLLPNLSRALGEKDDLTAGHVRRSSHGPVDAYYDAQLTERVNDVYAEDVAMWNALMGLDHHLETRMFSDWRAQFEALTSNQLDSSSALCEEKG